MVTTVTAGEKGVDFSFARPPAARLLELGYSFVVGYLSVPPASPAKNISKVECDAYIAAGLKVLLVWEMSATSPNQGAPAGQSHGRDAKLAAALRGYPREVPILCAVDTNTTPALIDAHEAYVKAFAEQCDPWPIGIYGDTDILTRCSGLWEIGWVPNAWSWSGSSRKDAEAKARLLGAHVLQRQGFYIDNRWAVDPNDAIADFPAWGLDVPTPSPQPPTVDDEEDAVRIKTPGQWFEKCGVDLRAIANGAEYAGLSGNEVILTLAEMEQLLGTCRYTYGVAKDDMGAGFVAAWNAHRQPAPSSGGGSSPYVVTLTGTATPGV
jgi:hypothetical protein